MAPGRKTGGRNFEKGNKFSKGGVPIPPEVKQAQKLNNATVTASIQKYYGLSAQELEEKRKDKSIPAGEMIIIAVMIHAINKGDEKRLASLLDRACGRVKQVVEHQGTQTIKIEEERRRQAFIEKLKDPKNAAAIESLRTIQEDIEDESDDESDPI